jgi:wax ester synthase-like acyl-CoA acyltransferase family protein
MADRLSALDASFLHLEERPAPLEVGSVAVFRRPRTGFDYGQLVTMIERRLPDITQSDVDLVAKMVEESVDELLTAPRRS